MSSEQIQQGDHVSCNECGHARPITKPVVEVFGHRVGFGPGGETDMFSEHDGDIICYQCIRESSGEIDAELPVIQ